MVQSILKKAQRTSLNASIKVTSVLPWARFSLICQSFQSRQRIGHAAQLGETNRKLTCPLIGNQHTIMHCLDCITHQSMPIRNIIFGKLRHSDIADRFPGDSKPKGVLTILGSANGICNGAPINAFVAFDPGTQPANRVHVTQDLRAFALEFFLALGKRGG